MPTRRLHNLPQHVAFEWCGQYRIGRLAGWPQAESVVVLGNQYDVVDIGRFGCAASLIGIQLGGIKADGIERAVAPFDVVIRINVKMNEHAEFQLYPPLLGGC